MRKNDDVIIIYGGSFNPPTTSHLWSAKTLYRALNPAPAQVWLLVSPQNPLKSTEGMAPHLDRLVMTELMAAPYPWLKASAIELGLGTTNTSETLRHLRSFDPDKRFVWAMGADNMAQFHQWHDWQWIMQHYPILVLEREPYTAQALKSEAAQFAKDLCRKRPQDAIDCGGWCLLPTPNARGIPATQAREDISRGETPLYIVPSVLSYAKRRGLYQKPAPSLPAQP